MRKKHQISLSPNGSGGLFFALQKHRILYQLKEKGVQYVHCFGIDNAMEYPADPLFLGFSSEQPSEICIKCVEKCCPEEQLSMIVEYGKKPLLAICSEMNYRQICRRDADGELVYRYGFLFDSIITVDFLLNNCLEASLPAYCHIVKKAIPYYDPILYRTVKPINPNAYKMEYYFSDIFPLAQSIAVVVVPREEYVPVINPPGKPIATPEKAVESISNIQLTYLKEMNIALENEVKNEPSAVEISPLVSIRNEGLSKLNHVSLHLPCSIYDHSEMDLTKTQYHSVSDTVIQLNQEVNGRSIYVV